MEQLVDENADQFPAAAQERGVQHDLALADERAGVDLAARRSAGAKLSPEGAQRAERSDAYGPAMERRQSPERVRHRLPRRRFERRTALKKEVRTGAEAFAARQREGAGAAPGCTICTFDGAAFSILMSSFFCSPFSHATICAFLRSFAIAL